MPFYTFLVFILNLFIILTPNQSLYSQKYELSIGAIFKNDAPYLKEWIEFHRLVGVEHFWLYNNLSDDNYMQVLQPYIKKGIVELINWPRHSSNVVEWNDIQCGAYKDAAYRSQERTKWIAFLDTDEYLFSPVSDSVPEILKIFKNKGGVGVNWVGFGTSHIEKLDPAIPMIEQLVLRAELDHPWHLHVKSIVKPSKVASIASPHYCELFRPYVNVNTQKKPFYGPYSTTIDHSLLRINHYWTRDESFFRERKMPQGKIWNRSKHHVITLSEALNQVYDGDIHRFLPQLKERLNSSP